MTTALRWRAEAGRRSLLKQAGQKLWVFAVHRLKPVANKRRLKPAAKQPFVRRKLVTEAESG
jgi:hypothetical protein